MSPANDVFACICRSVEDRYTDTALLCRSTARRSTPLCDGEADTLDALRTHAVHGEPGSPERIAAWRHIAHHLCKEAAIGGERDWTLIAVWLIAPRLRGAAYAIARRTGAEWDDVCSTLLQGALEAAQAIERADATQIEQHLVDAAFAVGWRTGRRSPKEKPVGNVGEQHSAWEEMVLQPLTTTPGKVVRVDVMSGALVQRAQGERLGSLAYRMGLLAHVRQERRRSRSGQRQTRTGVPQRLGESRGQPRLFEIQGAADEASS
ncbi:hypothetical protein [Streptomyces sp. NPDC001966]